MGKSLIQTTNQSVQTVAENSIISLGSVLRRYGCNLRLSGNAIEVAGEGYYTIDASVTASPTATGAVTVAVYADGVPLQGATASAYAGTASEPVNLSVVGTIRQGCKCDSATNLTVVLLEGAGEVSNISVRVIKE